MALASRSGWLMATRKLYLSQGIISCYRRGTAVQPSQLQCRAGSDCAHHSHSRSATHPRLSHCPRGTAVQPSIDYLVGLIAHIILIHVQRLTHDFRTALVAFLCNLR